MRKLVSIMLSLILIVCTAVPAFATEVKNATTIDGMDQYMTLTDYGTILFDNEEAVNAGYDRQMVDAVSAHIDSMNQLVSDGVAFIDDTFSANIYFMGPRAKGESKVVTHWYGLTEIYMNSDEADDLIANLSAIGDATTIAGLVGLLPYHIASVIGGMSTILGFGTMIYRWQVEAAAKSGNGIIMHIQTNFVDNTQTIWFTSQ